MAESDIYDDLDVFDIQKSSSELEKPNPNCLTKMDDVDLYSDLDHFDLGKTINELETKNNKLTCLIDELNATLDKMCKEVQDVKKVNETLKVNISELYKTAKSEIDRKNAMINSLRTELDALRLKKGGYAEAKRTEKPKKRKLSAPDSDSKSAKKAKTDEPSAKKRCDVEREGSPEEGQIDGYDTDHTSSSYGRGRSPRPDNKSEPLEAYNHDHWYEKRGSFNSRFRARGKFYRGGRFVPRGRYSGRRDDYRDDSHYQRRGSSKDRDAKEHRDRSRDREKERDHHDKYSKDPRNSHDKYTRDRINYDKCNRERESKREYRENDDVRERRPKDRRRSDEPEMKTRENCVDRKRSNEPELKTVKEHRDRERINRKHDETETKTCRENIDRHRKHEPDTKLHRENTDREHIYNESETKTVRENIRLYGRNHEPETITTKEFDESEMKACKEIIDNVYQNCDVDMKAVRENTDEGHKKQTPETETVIDINKNQKCIDEPEMKGLKERIGIHVYRNRNKKLDEPKFDAKEETKAVKSETSTKQTNQGNLPEKCSLNESSENQVQNYVMKPIETKQLAPSKAAETRCEINYTLSDANINRKRTLSEITLPDPRILTFPKNVIAQPKPEFVTNVNLTLPPVNPKLADEIMADVSSMTAVEKPPQKVLKIDSESIERPYKQVLVNVKSKTLAKLSMEASQNVETPKPIYISSVVDLTDEDVAEEVSENITEPKAELEKRTGVSAGNQRVENAPKKSEKVTGNNSKEVSEMQHKNTAKYPGKVYEKAAEKISDPNPANAPKVPEKNPVTINEKTPKKIHENGPENILETKVPEIISDKNHKKVNASKPRNEKKLRALFGDTPEKVFEKPTTLPENAPEKNLAKIYENAPETVSDQNLPNVLENVPKKVSKKTSRKNAAKIHEELENPRNVNDVSDPAKISESAPKAPEKNPANLHENIPEAPEKNIHKKASKKISRKHVGKVDENAPEALEKHEIPSNTTEKIRLQIQENALEISEKNIAVDKKVSKKTSRKHAANSPEEPANPTNIHDSDPAKILESAPKAPEENPANLHENNPEAPEELSHKKVSKRTCRKHSVKTSENAPDKVAETLTKAPEELSESVSVEKFPENDPAYENASTTLEELFEKIHDTPHKIRKKNSVSENAPREISKCEAVVNVLEAPENLIEILSDSPKRVPEKISKKSKKSSGKTHEAVDNKMTVTDSVPKIILAKVAENAPGKLSDDNSSKRASDKSPEPPSIAGSDSAPKKVAEKIRPKTMMLSGKSVTENSSDLFTEEVSEEMSTSAEDIPSPEYEKIEIVPSKAPDRAEILPERITEKPSKKAPERITEIAPEIIIESAPHKVTEVAPATVTETVPERVSENVPERVTETAPDTDNSMTEVTKDPGCAPVAPERTFKKTRRRRCVKMSIT